MEQDNIAYQIKKIRTDNKLTQLQLAEKLGVTFQSVSKWENGKNIPDVTLLNKIANEFDIDINVLLNGDDAKVVKKANKLLIVLFILLVVLLLVFLSDRVFNHETSSMKLTQISTSSSDFDISGSLVIDDSNAIIHISNIKYVGEKKDIIYKDVTFSLIEEYDNILTKIDEIVISDNKVEFDVLVDDVSFAIENYVSNCDTFDCNILFIKVYAIDCDGKSTIFEIPFISDDNCSCDN